MNKKYTQTNQKNEDQITPIRIMFFSRSFDITAFWSCFIDFLAAPVNLQKFLHSSSLYLAALYCIPCICFLCSSPLNNLQIFLSFRSFYLADLLALYPYLPSTIFSCLPCISAYLVALLTLQLCLLRSSVYLAALLNLQLCLNCSSAYLETLDTL